MRLLLLIAAIFLPAYAAGPDDWPRWRGPFDTGMARGDAPSEWNETKNLAWKIAIPGKGNSSPVVWGDKLFLTSAVPTQAAKAESPKGGTGGGAAAGLEHRFVLLCIDRNSGKVLWERTAAVSSPHEGYHFRYGSFASNSPVTDGKTVYAFFGSRGLYAYDLDGKLLWKKDFPPLKMRLQFGEGTAVVLADDRLILNCDQEGGSYIVAFDKASGKELWRNERDEPSSWSAPLVLTHDGKKQVVTAATNKVRSYDLLTGKLIWECAGLGGNVIPAPVTKDGIVYVMSGFRNPNLLAIRLGRQGDLTGSDAVLWSHSRGNYYTPSPVLFEDKLYFISDTGMLTCLNAKTGEPYYLQQRLGKPYNFKASPVGANGKLYLSTEDGDVVVVKMGEKFEVLATNTMPDEMFISTPAILDGTIYLRGRETLYCIRRK